MRAGRPFWVWVFRMRQQECLPLDASRSRAYCVASKCKHESGNHHRILHGLKLRTEGRQFGGENPYAETANRFVETRSLRRWRL